CRWPCAHTGPRRNPRGSSRSRGTASTPGRCELRVIAGSAKGRILRPPRTSATRPITDRAKESLFAILTPRIPRARFLDLFAGTGSVGIEALSRGCASAVFVERSRQALAGIRHNLEVTRLAAHAHRVARDLVAYPR